MDKPQENQSPQSSLEEWNFDFGLCSQDGKQISETDCNQLLDLIIDWAEQHGYGIGGGFRPFDESD